MSAAGAIRTALLRTVFLLIGAALFLAFGLLGLSVAAVGRTTAHVFVGVVGVVLVVALLVAVSLFPGVRDVEVAAARILLDPDGELVEEPAEPRRHRWRTTWFVLAHVLLGGLTGTALVVGIPLAASELPWYAAVGAVVGILAAVAALGILLARLAVVCLGPTDTDRLAVAEQRIRREHGQRMLARDLHDGIGHALSVISLQAVAGRRVVDRDPEHAAESLEIIARTARDALDELDHALGVLRDEPTARLPEQRLTDVPALVASYVSAGADVRADLAEPAGIAPLVSREAYRIVQEALTNAHKHGDGTAIVLTTHLGPALVVEVRNGIGARATSRGQRSGHGLAGLRERVALLGGKLEVGTVDATTWVLLARVPLGIDREPRP
ncbi:MULTISPECIES: sensor histidine kinase [Mumia]|uniref:sensor histidine kinase n=1 Tax=Mumia TaxID=1546255 RepID=UPI001420C449|nr:histidine kinase [Mumia sp. ZJ1417]QMW66340.1 histidine kinase [Mumia sp. ZJ1417]